MQLSAANEERSSFVRSSLGVSVLHSNFPATKIDYWTALRASGTRYFTSKLTDALTGKTIDEESEVFLLGRWNYQVVSGLSLSLNGSAYALDQIYDVSDTKYRNIVTHIETKGISVGPALRWDLTKAWWIKVEADGKRENSPDGFNNRTARDATLRLGWKPLERFEVSVAGSENRRDYDSREQYLGDGTLAAGTRLKVAVREAELRFDVTLDEAAHWHTGLRLSALRFADNGAGYLKYRQRKIAPEVEWTSGNWHVYLETSARRLDYELQTVGAGFPPLPKRVSDNYFAHLQIERNLSRRWTVYLDYTWERDRSNDEVASYSMNEGLLGLRWNWEK